MARDILVEGRYPGRSNHRLALYVQRINTDAANNRSDYYWQISAHRDGAWGGTFYNDPLPWRVNIGGREFSGSAGLPFSSSVKDILLASGTTGWFTHNSDGDLGLGIWASHGGGQFGVAVASGTFFVDRLPRLPGAPGWISITDVGTDRMTVNWGIAANNGANLDAYLIRHSRTEDFAVYDDVQVSSLTYLRQFTGLAPGMHYWRVYAHNELGYGPSSPIAAQATLTTAAPGLSVSPSPSGTFVDLAMTPPGGSSGVTKYAIQRRPAGGGTVTGWDVASNAYRDVAVIPGNSYEWRASAFFGSYQSPWSGWIQATMPNPNLNPGTTYWDGSSPATPNGSFAWVGTPNLSASVQNGVRPAGWLLFEDDNPTGANGAVYRGIGGLFGTYAAVVQVRSDPIYPDYGLVMGVSVDGGGSVEEGETYWGSIYARITSAVSPAVMQAGIAWYGPSGFLGYTWGAASQRPSLAANFQWERYVVSGVAPAGATKGAPVIRPAGTVEAPFTLQGGMTFMLDGAMLSLGELVPFFSGDTQDAPGYDYQWVGAANASPSIRYRVPTSTVDAIVDPDCAPLPAPPTPPTVPSDCIDEVGEWRRYAVSVPASEVHIWRAALPTLVISTKSAAERQVRIRYYPNPDQLIPSQLNQDDWEAEQILSYVPPNTRVTLDGITRRVRAEVNGGAVMPANNLLYGTGGTPASWPELACGSAYVITLDVPRDAPSGNLSTELYLTERM